MNSREAFEEWCAIKSDSDYREGAWDAWQASRKQLLKELSEKEPIGYASFVEGEMFACVSTQDCERWEIRTHDMTPVIIRPTEEE